MLPAQRLAQTRPGAKGALLLHGVVPVSTFGTDWPAGVPLQMHVMEQDAMGDVDVARELARTVTEAELHLYPGGAHLFTDAGTDGYDAEATRLVMERTLAMLRRVS